MNLLRPLLAVLDAARDTLTSGSFRLAFGDDPDEHGLTMRVAGWHLQLDSDGLMFIRVDGACDHDEDDDVAPGHTLTSDCPCGVLEVPVKRDDGEVVWISVHRIGDDVDPSRQAERAVTVFEAMDEARREDDE